MPCKLYHYIKSIWVMSGMMSTVWAYCGLILWVTACMTLYYYTLYSCRSHTIWLSRCEVIVSYVLMSRVMRDVVWIYIAWRMLSLYNVTCISIRCDVYDYTIWCVSLWNVMCIITRYNVYHYTIQYVSLQCDEYH